MIPLSDTNDRPAMLRRIADEHRLARAAGIRTRRLLRRVERPRPADEAICRA